MSTMYRKLLELKGKNVGNESGNEGRSESGNVQQFLDKYPELTSAPFFEVTVVGVGIIKPIAESTETLTRTKRFRITTDSKSSDDKSSDESRMPAIPTPPIATTDQVRGTTTNQPSSDMMYPDVTVPAVMSGNVMPKDMMMTLRNNTKAFEDVTLRRPVGSLLERFCFIRKYYKGKVYFCNPSNQKSMFVFVATTQEAIFSNNKKLLLEMLTFAVIYKLDIFIKKDMTLVDYALGYHKKFESNEWLTPSQALAKLLPELPDVDDRKVGYFLHILFSLPIIWELDIFEFLSPMECYIRALSVVDGKLVKEQPKCAPSRDVYFTVLDAIHRGVTDPNKLIEIVNDKFSTFLLIIKN